MRRADWILPPANNSFPLRNHQLLRAVLFRSCLYSKFQIEQNHELQPVSHTDGASSPQCFLAALLPVLSQAQQGEESHRTGGTSAAQPVPACPTIKQDWLFLTLFLWLFHCWITVLSQQCVPGLEPRWQSHWHDQESSHPPEPEVHSTKSSKVCAALCI